MAVLEARSLGKSYGTTCIIEDTSFSLEEGQSIAFVSPSGSGKSTLLSLLGLLLEPTSGEVVLDGKCAQDLSDEQRSVLRRTMIGFIFQHTQLVGSLRAVENVMAPALFAKMPSGEARERAEELLVRFGLSERIEHYPYQLSIGQKRRIAAARALMLSPKLIIADEPTNDLDAASAKTVADTLFDHVSAGGSLLYATHDPDLAARADTIMRLQGKTFRVE